MLGDRLVGSWPSGGAGGNGLSAARLCAVFPQIAGVTGAGVMLMSCDVPRGSLCTTNDMSQLIEDLQYTLDEGLCLDAYQRGPGRRKDGKHHGCTRGQHAGGVRSLA
jgi:hypothetical protein